MTNAQRAADQSRLVVTPIGLIKNKPMPVMAMLPSTTLRSLLDHAAAAAATVSAADREQRQGLLDSWVFSNSNGDSNADDGEEDTTQQSVGAAAWAQHDGGVHSGDVPSAGKPRARISHGISTSSKPWWRLRHHSAGGYPAPSPGPGQSSELRRHAGVHDEEHALHGELHGGKGKDHVPRCSGRCYQGSCHIEVDGAGCCYVNRQHWWRAQPGAASADWDEGDVSVEYRVSEEQGGDDDVGEGLHISKKHYLHARELHCWG